MKVLQLGKFFPVRGGVEKVMWDITLGLCEAGVECDMLCAAFQKERVKISPVGEVGKLITVKSYTKKAGTMIAPAMISYLRFHCREYDIIHIHHPDPMAALALRLSSYRGKVVLHWHSDIVSQRFFLALYMPLQKWLLHRTSRIICTSPVYAKSSHHLRKFLGKCIAIPIGVRPMPDDREGAQKIRRRFPEGAKIIFSLGRLVPYKGYSYLVEALNYLPEEYHLLLGGEGPQRHEIEEKVRRFGLSGRVTLLGYVPDEDIPALFGACDVFALSSVMKTEAFAVVQIEAMSLGKPVVATRIPGSGVSWVNSEGRSGVNVMPRDAMGLAWGIKKVLSSSSTYSSGARELFSERYTIEKFIGGIIKEYNKLLNNIKI